MTIKTLNIDYSYQRLIHLTIAALILLFGLYIYFIAGIIWDAASREKTLTQANELTSKVSTLETEYVSLSGKVTLELASALGFTESGDRSGFALAN